MERMLGTSTVVRNGARKLEKNSNSVHPVFTRRIQITSNTCGHIPNRYILSNPQTLHLSERVVQRPRNHHFQIQHALGNIVVSGREHSFQRLKIRMEIAWRDLVEARVVELPVLRILISFENIHVRQCIVLINVECRQYRVPPADLEDVFEAPNIYSMQKRVVQLDHLRELSKRLEFVNIREILQRF